MWLCVNSILLPPTVTTNVLVVRAVCMVITKSTFYVPRTCVIGIGGVGSWAVEALARTGIGELTLIDMDDVCVTNINRQIHAMTGTIGKSKIEVMAERVKLINPECKVNLVDDFITPDNQHLYLNKSFDYVLDAIDSLKAKASLLAYCRSNKIKVITVGGAGGQTDPTQITVADLTKTIQDPLAKKLKDRLRQHHNFPTNPARKFGIDCGSRPSNSNTHKLMVRYAPLNPLRKVPNVWIAPADLALRR